MAQLVQPPGENPIRNFYYIEVTTDFEVNLVFGSWKMIAAAGHREAIMILIFIDHGRLQAQIYFPCIKKFPIDIFLKGSSFVDFL